MGGRARSTAGGDEMGRSLPPATLPSRSVFEILFFLGDCGPREDLEQVASAGAQGRGWGLSTCGGPTEEHPGWDCFSSGTATELAGAVHLPAPLGQQHPGPDP